MFPLNQLPKKLKAKNDVIIFEAKTVSIKSTSEEAKRYCGGHDVKDKGKEFPLNQLPKKLKASLPTTYRFRKIVSIKSTSEEAKRHLYINHIDQFFNVSIKSTSEEAKRLPLESLALS